MILLSSCEDYLDVNKNPNNPERVSMESAFGEFLFPNRR